MFQYQSQCPCGLTQELLDRHRLIGPGGLCTADDCENNICGKRFVDHPHQQTQSGRL